MAKNKYRDTIREAQVKKTAKLLGVSQRYVNMILDGDRKSEDVLAVFMEIADGENKLLREVEKILPFITQKKTA